MLNKWIYESTNRLRFESFSERNNIYDSGEANILYEFSFQRIWVRKPKVLRWSPGSIPSSMEKKSVQGRLRILSKVT